MRNRLKAMQITKADDGKLEDGGGLRLVKKGEAGKWVYRYSHLGKRREMGLGNWPTISLADARKARDAWAAELAAGRDPISIRNEQQDAARAERDRHNPSFADLVDLVFEAKRDTLRGGGARGRWRSPLDLYAIPAFGRKRGSDVSQWDIVEALRPIWRTKHPTAEKCLQRVGVVLRSARRMGFPTSHDAVDAAKEMLGAVNHVPKPTPSVPWQDIPELYASLPETSAGMCNRWLILTLVRMAAGRAAAVDEIEGDVWTVPAARVKGRKGKVQDFRVPLCGPAVEIAAAAQEYGQDYLFPGLRGGPITDAAVEKCLRSVGADGTPHGFRASFRTWVQDRQACSWEVSEGVLGHIVGSKVERAYARSDLLDQRRIVMDTWARYVTGGSGNVLSILA